MKKAASYFFITTLVSFCLAYFPATPARAAGTITINSSQTFQTMVGWEAVATVGDGNDVLTWNNQVIDLAVNDLGINRLRLEIRSGAENPTDWYTQYKNGGITHDEWRNKRYEAINDNSNPNSVNTSGFWFTALDEKIDQVVTPMRQKMAQRGESLYVSLNFVDFANSTFKQATNAAEYAEFMLHTFQHIQSKYGWVPDGIEMILEPDLISWWTGTRIGNAIVATGDKLAANGFHPDFIAPSTTSAAAAPTYFDEGIAVPRVNQYIDMLSYHRYTGASTTVLQNIASKASSYGIQTGMLEWIGATYNQLHDDLKIANVSAWQQFTLAYPIANNGVTDNGAQYYVIDNNNPSNPIISLGSRTKFLRQYFKFIRKGAVRIGANTTNSSFDPVAFRNTNNTYAVVVKAATGGTFDIAGLPAGTYGIKYTTNSAYDVNLSNVAINNGGSIPVNMPAAGVITIYSTTGSAPPPQNNPPTISSGIPSGTLSANTSQVTLSVSTNENATCKYSTTPGTSYNSMPNTFSVTGSTSHSRTITGLSNGNSYSYYIRCIDSQGAATTSDYTISFSIANPVDTTPPVISAGSPSGTLSANTSQVTLSVSTNENATCKYSTTPGTSYNSMTTFLSTGGATHSAVIPGHTNGVYYTYFIKCRDLQNNVNQTDYTISFQIANSPINTPPVISSISSGTPQQTSATITWLTDKFSSSQVEYGLTSNYGLNTPLNSDLVTSHSVNITGLTAGTTYHYRVKSKDNSNNLAASTDRIFTTSAVPDTTPPIISAGSPSGTLPANTSQVTLSVSTNEAATCRYTPSSGISYSAIPNTFSTTGSTSHSTTITGLSNKKSHTYYVRCADLTNNSNATDTIITFEIAEENTFTGNVVINNDSQTVNNPSVTLDINVFPTVNKIMVSNLSSFEGASAETYKNAKLWNLCTQVSSCTSGTKTVYVKFLNSEDQVVAEDSDSIILQLPPEETNPEPGQNTQNNNTQTVQTRLVKNSSGTYYFIINNVKRGVTNPAMLATYGFEFKDAVAETTEETSLPTGDPITPGNGSLVKSPADQTVYLISENRKHAFSSSEVFFSLGFSFQNVLLVTSPELQNLQNGEVISEVRSHKQGTNINHQGTIYWIGGIYRHPYTSIDIYNSWNKDNDFSTVVPANQSDLNVPVGPPVVMRVVQ